MQSTHPSNTQKLSSTKALKCVQGSAPIKAPHALHSMIPPSRNTARSGLTMHRTPCNRSSQLKLTLQAQLTSDNHPLWCTTNMQKANDPWKVVDEDKSSRPPKLKPVLIATKEKANPLVLSFRDSGNTTIPLSIPTKLNTFTNFTSPNVFRKRMSNLHLKSWKLFLGQYQRRKMSLALLKFWKSYAAPKPTHNCTCTRCTKRGVATALTSLTL